MTDEADLFRILHLLNSGSKDAICADNFLQLLTLCLQGRPSVSSRAKRILRDWFNTEVEIVRSF
jgi:hypothetical protein